MLLEQMEALLLDALEEAQPGQMGADYSSPKGE